MKNLLGNKLDFKNDSLRSLAASLKNALKQDNLSETDAHERGWELARKINESTDGKFNPSSIQKWLTSNLDDVTKITGLKSKSVSGNVPKEQRTNETKSELVETKEVKAIKESSDAINEKVRKLFALDFKCADIRKFLDIDYQRVKNVEKRMKKTGAKK